MAPNVSPILELKVNATCTNSAISWKNERKRFVPQLCTCEVVRFAGDLSFTLLAFEGFLSQVCELP